MTEGPRISGFEHKRRLGSGGFATVHLYSQVSSGALFAVKVLPGSVTELERQQFDQEARALGRLTHEGQHPNIVTINSNGVTAAGELYLAMEYCPDRSYADRLAETGKPVDVPEVLRVGVQVADALYRAHTNGIVHRDVKPANILIAGTLAKLSDFGIAAVTSEQRERGTRWRTPEYAAPEVLETGEADELGDVFSLAATLYELAVGRPWCGTGTPEDIARRVRECRVPSIALEVGPELDRLLRRVMTRDRDARATAVRPSPFTGRRAEYVFGFGEALRRVQDELEYRSTPQDARDGPTPEATPGPIGVPKPATVPAHALPEPEPPTPSPFPVRALVAVVVGTLILAGAVTGVWLVGRGHKPPTGPSVPGVQVAPTVPLAGPVPVPEVRASVDGNAVRFTWTYEPVVEGDYFRVKRTDQPDAAAQSVARPEFVVTVAPRERPCVEVTVVRANGKTSVNGGRACAP